MRADYTEHVSREEWSIYSLHDPRTKVIRYVGITAQPLAVRYQGHLHGRENLAKHDWIHELRALGLKPIMRRLAFFDGTAAEARDAETAWIALIAARGGDLLNIHQNRGPAPGASPAGKLGARILRRLSDLGMSQNALQQRAGLPQGQVTRLIKGERGFAIRPRWVFAIARALRCRPEWLWLGERSEEPAK